MAGSFPVDIDVHTFHDMREKGENLWILDVRQPWETDICAFEDGIRLPLASLPEGVDRIPRDRAVVVVCHHGIRSKHAVSWLRANGFDNAINLSGGIDAWARQMDPTMATY
ncbi:rhodanese-like domain-containing protein [Varunaivibrio sulfuroxidans]|uniref:Rhodanese-related sulfurtransferase n=1 Tax=Varunaivibrio sulfuroxidans TaxID=1773489 RepID=A0A4R3J8T7_9PROT|nr:rhodanese-like domain-containing protein [Varunaivibrio sulfuroxidans]TCS61343.1 rhodanese-related sulfurtransferase [Varunaivibrio sulfuroxidans]WES31044.1 rhodanese-like domain-containing protein [Varunaivibrio sulfuroxidans]